VKKIRGLAPPRKRDHEEHIQHLLSRREDGTDGQTQGTRQETRAKINYFTLKAIEEYLEREEL
jgi:hypothetical protein